MRIAFIEPHLELYGGIRRVIELSNRLTRLGDDVVIFHPTGERCSWMEGLATTRPTRELARETFDAVIFNDPPHYELAMRARARVKAFYLLCLDDRERLRSFSPKIFWPRKGRVMALKRALSLPFLRIANASWMKWYLEDTLGIECELLIGGINREVFHPVDVKRDREVFRILCTGDPRERKGMDTIHRAFDLVTRSGQDIVTRRAGDALDLRTDDLVRSGNERTELFTYHGLGIPQEKMAETYSSADLFVDAQWYAGWNNPVAEAMACGVPVVCTDIGGVSDFAFHEETAVLFPAGDADRLASAITRMIVDTSLRERLKRNALNRIARFDWDESARRLHHLLENRLA